MTLCSNWDFELPHPFMYYLFQRLSGTVFDEITINMSIGESLPSIIKKEWEQLKSKATTAISALRENPLVTPCTFILRVINLLFLALFIFFILDEILINLKIHFDTVSKLLAFYGITGTFIVSYVKKLIWRLNFFWSFLWFLFISIPLLYMSKILKLIFGFVKTQPNFYEK